MRGRIVGRLEAGQCQVQICREFNLTPSVSCNLWKKFKDTGSIERKLGPSRPRATTVREKARRNRGTTVSQLSRYLYAARITCVPRVTVSKRLRESALFARKPAVSIPLTSTNSLNTDSCRMFIWREPGTRYLSSNVREIDHKCGGGLMVWAGIMLDGRTPLHVFERSVRYSDEVLEPYDRLFRGAPRSFKWTIARGHVELFWSTNF
ncbi:transposable element Tcb2 transposase [Trichonephila clavipes]|nr:transposable element Tcb2 transposase [Trichonephila clavipes]